MKKTPTPKPFFARLLEEQELDAVTGGSTLKYPSDGDEHGKPDPGTKTPERTIKSNPDSDDVNY